MVVVGNCSPQSMHVILEVFIGRGMLEKSELDTIVGYCRRRVLAAVADGSGTVPSGVAVASVEGSGLGESVTRVEGYCA